MKKILLVVTIVIFLLAILADRSYRMPLLTDISSGKFSEDDPNARMNSITRQMNEWGRQISNEDRTKITKDDTGTNRLLQGYQKDGFDNGNVGIKLSQPDKNVLTASSGELIWSSDFNSFKIVASGNIDMVISTSSTYKLVTYEHGLGYTPMCLVYYENGNYALPLPYMDVGGEGSGTYLNYTRIFTAWTDNNKLYIDFTEASAISGFTFSFKYYLIRETANPE